MAAVPELDAVTVRFAGDSADGMALAGRLFAAAAVAAGDAVATRPDVSAEIRAPAGTLPGVAGLQVRFGAAVHTPGDVLDCLVAMNAAALKVHLGDLRPGGLLVVNGESFAADDLERAGYGVSPLGDGSLAGYRVARVPMATLTREAVADRRLSPRETDRCKNFFALGLVCRLYDRPSEPTVGWVREKFARNRPLADATLRAFRAGSDFCEAAGLAPLRRVPTADTPVGRHRQVTGNEALALGLVAAAKLAGKPLVFAGSPLAPATSILEGLTAPAMRRFGVRAMLAEDEAAACGVAVGASYAGAVGVTATSGPGVGPMAEVVNLAVVAELPLVVVNVQRAGPGTGLPAKVGQADLLQALFGRSGESPVVVLAPASPADCYQAAVEAVRLATRFMTPVVVLSDADLACSAELWRVPDPATLAPIAVRHPTVADGRPPYQRDADLARLWVLPGTPGLEHRLSGHEKQPGGRGHDPAGHARMVDDRWRKVEAVAAAVTPLAVAGDSDAGLLVLGWGGTRGRITEAVELARRRGRKVAYAHLRHLNPLPANTEEVLKRYPKVLVPELNTGQLCWLLRAKYLVPAEGLCKAEGRAFLAAEVLAAIERLSC